jgi:hypothetical protein
VLSFPLKLLSKLKKQFTRARSDKALIYIEIVKKQMDTQDKTNKRVKKKNKDKRVEENDEIIRVSYTPPGLFK